jgi:hypothetical protein
MTSSFLNCSVGLAAALILVTSTLGDDATAQTSVAVSSDSITGIWKGARTAGPFSTEVTFDLQQAGSKVVGMAQWGLSPSGLGGTGGPIEVVKTGSRFTFQVPSLSFTGELELTGDEMRGTLIGPFEYSLVLRKHP